MSEAKKQYGYDQMCNHCGKDIHPYDGKPLAFIEDQITPDMTDEEVIAISAKATKFDCVYVQRFNSNSLPQHGLTNYICLGCAEELDAWFRNARVR